MTNNRHYGIRLFWRLTIVVLLTLGIVHAVHHHPSTSPFLNDNTTTSTWDSRVFKPVTPEVPSLPPMGSPERQHAGAPGKKQSGGISSGGGG